MVLNSETLYRRYMYIQLWPTNYKFPFFCHNRIYYMIYVKNYF